MRTFISEELPLRIRIPGQKSPPSLKRYRGKGKGKENIAPAVASEEVKSCSRTVVAQSICGIVYLVDATPPNKNDAQVHIYATEDILREHRNPHIIGTYNTETGAYIFYDNATA